MLSTLAVSVLLNSHGAHLPVVAPRPDAGADESASLVAAYAFSFIQAGLEPVEAGHLADLLVFGQEALSSGSGCLYYVVTTQWCAGGTLRQSSSAVGTMCIQGLGLNLCALLPCPAGMAPYFKVTTASSGCPSRIPAGVCAFVSVAGPLVSESETLCDTLADCGCWPGLSCGLRECVPVVAGTGLAAACPECAPPLEE